MRYLVLMLLLAVPALAQPAGGPSFDCARARAWDERTICAFADLAALDRQIATAWRRLNERASAGERARLMAGQRAWLQERRACEGPVARDAQSCLRRLMRARARDLTALADAGPAGASSGSSAPAAPGKPPPAEATPGFTLRAADCARPAGWAAQRICAVPGMRDLDAAVVREAEAARARFAANPEARRELEQLLQRYLAEREACTRVRGRLPVDCLQETMEDVQAALRRRIARG